MKRTHIHVIFLCYIYKENPVLSNRSSTWKKEAIYCIHVIQHDCYHLSEAEASHVIEATIKSADVSATSELISSEIELSVHSGRTDTELPVQLDGDEKSKKLYLKETVNSETYEKKLPSMSEVETYDEITKSEVTSLDDWEDVQESCLSETPPVDPEALRDLESRANDIAGNLDHLLTSLGNNLKAMSHVSTECLDAYSTCVDHMSETVDVNVKAMYTLIARCEELNASLKPVQHMAEQIKDIKKTLDIFEALCK